MGTRSGSALQGPRLKAIDQASELYAQTKEHMFEAKAAEEQGKLLKYISCLKNTISFSTNLMVVMKLSGSFVLVSFAGRKLYFVDLRYFL